MILIICTATFISTLLGGLFALKFQSYRYLILGFCAGAMISIALFDLIPTALELLDHVNATCGVLGMAASGFILYLLANRAITILSTDKKEASGTSATSTLIASFLVLHSFLDGIAIGLAYQVSTAIGGVVSAAILVHDFADGMNTANVVIKSTGNFYRSLKWLVVNAVAPFLGALSTYFYKLPAPALGVLLAFMSGCFLFIGAAEFLPESMRSGKRWKSALLTIIGFVLLFAVIHFAGG